MERDKKTYNVEEAKYIPCNRVSFYIHGYYAFSKADVYSRTEGRGDIIILRCGKGGEKYSQAGLCWPRGALPLRNTVVVGSLSQCLLKSLATMTRDRTIRIVAYESISGFTSMSDREDRCSRHRISRITEIVHATTRVYSTNLVPNRGAFARNLEFRKKNCSRDL